MFEVLQPRCGFNSTSIAGSKRAIYCRKDLEFGVKHNSVFWYLHELKEQCNRFAIWTGDVSPNFCRIIITSVLTESQNMQVQVLIKKNCNFFNDAARV